MNNLVEIDRCNIIDVSGSQYMLVPKALRRKYSTEIGDEVTFFGMAESDDTVIRIEKHPSEKVNSNV